jgi:hypothetical protein
MRNLLAGLAVLTLLFAGLGWYRSWYTVHGAPADSGKLAFRVEVDLVKVGTDAADAAKRVQQALKSEKKEESAAAKE